MTRVPLVSDATIWIPVSFLWEVEPQIQVRFSGWLRLHTCRKEVSKDQLTSMPWLVLLEVWFTSAKDIRFSLNIFSWEAKWHNIVKYSLVLILDGAIGEQFEGYLQSAEDLLFKEVPTVVQGEKNTRICQFAFSLHGCLCDVALLVLVLISSHSSRETSCPSHRGMALPYSPDQTRK